MNTADLRLNSDQSSSNPDSDTASPESNIKLIDYLAVILKYKILILIIILVTTGATAAVNMFLPQTFEATTLLQIGTIKGAKIASIEDTIQAITSDTFLTKIANLMNLSTKNIDVSAIKKMFKLEKAPKGDLLLITGLGSAPDKAVKTTNVVSAVIIARHQELFQVAEQTFLAEVETIKKEKAEVNNETKLIQAQLKQLEQNKNLYNNEIKLRANAQTDAQGRIVQSYLQLLQDVQNQLMGLTNKLQQKNNQLLEFDLTLQKKNFEKQYETKPTVIISEPLPPQHKIAPKRRQNVILAGIISIFVAIFSAFCVEYYQKNKVRIYSGKAKT